MRDVQSRDISTPILMYLYPVGARQASIRTRKDKRRQKVNSEPSHITSYVVKQETIIHLSVSSWGANNTLTNHVVVYSLGNKSQSWQGTAHLLKRISSPMIFQCPFLLLNINTHNVSLPYCPPLAVCGVYYKLIPSIHPWVHQKEVCAGKHAGYTGESRSLHL